MVEDMISSGYEGLDEFLGGGYRKELTMVQGAGATGKTTLCLVACCDILKKDKKVVYLDTENGFSIERFMQICGPGYLLMLDRLLILKARDFEEQCKKVDSLIHLVNIDLVIIDSLSVHYRKEVRDDSTNVNKKMDRQLRVLTEVGRRGVAVVVTNQVSTNPETGLDHMVGGNMVKQWGNSLIELKKDPRRIILKKPEERETNFEIVNEGIKLL